MCCNGSQGSVVGTVIRPWVEYLRNHSSTPGRDKRSLLQNVHSLWDHPAFCVMCIGGFFHWVKFVIFDICIASDPVWLYIFHFISFLVRLWYVLQHLLHG